MLGYSIGEQVCRIRAQMYHVTKYQQQNTGLYEENAKQYVTMYRPSIVNRVMRNKTNIEGMNKLMDKTEREMQDFIGSDDEGKE